MNLSAKQQCIISLLSELTTESALAGTRQRKYCLSLDIHTFGCTARFMAYRVVGAKNIYEDNLGYPLSEANKNPICYDSFSLGNDQHFNDVVGFLRNAVNTAKKL